MKVDAAAIQDLKAERDPGNYKTPHARKRRSSRMNRYKAARMERRRGRR